MVAERTAEATQPHALQTADKRHMWKQSVPVMQEGQPDEISNRDDESEHSR